MIEHVKIRAGQHRARFTCDDKECEASTEVPVPLIQGNKSGRAIYEEGRARKKIVGLGWTVKGKKHFCPECSKRSEDVTSKPNMKDPEVVERRLPTMEIKREIMGYLTIAYDVGAQRYTGDETDTKVAQAIGNGCMAGWVAEIRDEFFGPAGSEELDEIERKIDAKLAEVDRAVGDVNKALGAMRQVKDDLVSLRGRVEAMKKAIGPKAGHL